MLGTDTSNYCFYYPYLSAHHLYVPPLRYRSRAALREVGQSSGLAVGSVGDSDARGYGGRAESKNK